MATCCGKKTEPTSNGNARKVALVGNPNVGKQVFEKDPAAGLYLPLRVYIYQGSDNKAYLSYDKPSVVLKPFNNTSIDQTAAMLDQKLDTLTHMVAQ